MSSRMVTLKTIQSASTSRNWTRSKIIYQVYYPQTQLHPYTVSNRQGVAPVHFSRSTDSIIGCQNHVPSQGSTPQGFPSSPQALHCPVPYLLDFYVGCYGVMRMTWRYVAQQQTWWGCPWALGVALILCYSWSPPHCSSPPTLYQTYGLGCDTATPPAMLHSAA